MDDLKSQYCTQFDEVKNLAMEYKDTVLGLQSKVGEQQHAIQSKVEDLVGSVSAFKSEVETHVQDMSDVDTADFKHLSHVYSWLTICFVAFTICRILGAMFSFIFALFTGGSMIALNVYVLMPLYTLLYLKKAGADEVAVRHFVLMCTMSLGMCIGHLFSDKSMPFYFPPAFGVCFAIVVASTMLKQKPRTAFIGTSLGIAAGFFIMFGMVFGMSGGYMMWMVLALGVFAFDIQMKIGQVRAGHANVGVGMMTSVILYVYVFSLAYFMHGCAPEDVPKEK